MLKPLDQVSNFLFSGPLYILKNWGPLRALLYGGIPVFTVLQIKIEKF